MPWPQATGGSGSTRCSISRNLTGSNYNDTLTGNSGANSLNRGTGADVLTGGDGSDSYYVDNIGDVVSETNAVLAGGGTDMVNSPRGLHPGCQRREPSPAGCGCCQWHR